MILRGIFHVVSCFPLHFMLYRRNLYCYFDDLHILFQAPVWAGQPWCGTREMSPDRLVYKLTCLSEFIRLNKYVMRFRRSVFFNLKGLLFLFFELLPNKQFCSILSTNNGICDKLAITWTILDYVNGLLSQVPV